MRKLTPYAMGRGMAVSAAVSALVCVVLWLGFDYLTERQALESSRSVAELTFASYFALMKQGATRGDLERYARTLEAAHGASYRVEVRRPPAAGCDGGAPDAELARAFAGGERRLVRAGDVARMLYPVQVQAECQRCHVGTRLGTVLGVVDVRHDMGPDLRVGRIGGAVLLVALFSFPLVGAALGARALGRRIERSVHAVRHGFERVSLSPEGGVGEVKDVDLGFAEFDTLLTGLLGKLRSVTQDLQFGIDTLARLTITTGSLKDWRREVTRLLLEINEVTPTRALFGLFEDGAGGSRLEVFWRGTPGSATRGDLEGTVAAALGQGPQAQLAQDAAVAHSVAMPDSAMDELPAGRLAAGTRVVALRVPGVGGVLAAGLVGEAVSGSRGLILDGVLSTLANVMGSLRAIDGYVEQVTFHATRDPLTGLSSQKLFRELLAHGVERARRRGEKLGALVLDLDGFKLVNDGHGHSFGDQYLVEVARVLRGCIRGEDVAARYGGDEFALMLPGADSEQVSLVAGRVLDRLAALALTAPEGRAVTATASLGGAVFPDHAVEPEPLFELAHRMVYRSKAGGKNRLCLPTGAALATPDVDVGEASAILSAALAQDRIVPYFQPIMNLVTGEVAAHEVLMRAVMPGRVVPASELVETAEEMGLITRIDLIVLEKAFRHLRERAHEGRLLVNLSPKALACEDFMRSVHCLVATCGPKPAQLVFELTERETVTNLSLLEGFIAKLRREGFGFAIDDFGSGFSSFLYLRRFPIDFLKVDGEFVRGMTRADGIDRAIVTSVAALAHGLRIHTIAEYVENAGVMRAACAAGIGFGQGYHIGRPAPELVRDSARRASGAPA